MFDALAETRGVYLFDEVDAGDVRRFDAVISYPLPTAPVARDVIRNRLANVRLGRISWPPGR